MEHEKYLTLRKNWISSMRFEKEFQPKKSTSNHVIRQDRITCKILHLRYRTSLYLVMLAPKAMLKTKVLKWVSNLWLQNLDPDFDKFEFVHPDFLVIIFK